MLEKMKIMVVDDNTVNLATVEQDLKDKYEVIPMISGRRAVKYLYREKVDLILLDVQMPIMDGIETLREIRTQQNGTTVPVIFLTSKKDKNTVIEGSKLGIMDYITKPFDAEDLQQRIEQVFKRLGRFPMEDEELLHRVRDIISDLENGKEKAAAHKMEEVLGYQIDDEVVGRLKNAQVKMGADKKDGAISMLQRVARLLEKTISSGYHSSAMPISTGEINARLLYVLDDLNNFKIREASGKIQDLLRFDLPAEAGEIIRLVKEKLDEYDDDEAEVLVQNLLDKMKKNHTLNVTKKESRPEETGGYHYSRLL